MLLLMVFSLGTLMAQDNESYSDQDLKNYIKINNSLQFYRMGIKTKADSLRESEGLSEGLFLEIIGRVREGEKYPDFKSDYPADKIAAFEKTMSYRQFLRENMQKFLQAELQKVDWDMDYYQHLAMSIEAIPELQQRLIDLSK